MKALSLALRAGGPRDERLSLANSLDAHFGLVDLAMSALSLDTHFALLEASR